MRKVRTAVLVLALAAELPADTIFLRDGTALKGRLVSASGQRIRFVEAGQSAARTYAVNTVDHIGFGDDNRTADTGGYSGPSYPNATGERARTASAAVPTGTVIKVRMIDSINSDKTNVGNSYRANVDEPVIVDGRTIAPQGADAAVRAQRVGTEETGLVLSEITVNGRKYSTTTENAEVSAKSHSKGSAAVIGGSAVVGAIIGAFAGGGKGTTVGAADEAGAGASIQVIRGQKIQIPSETRLDFRLAQPIYLQ